MKAFKLFLTTAFFGAFLVFQGAALAKEVTFTAISDTLIKSDKAENKMTPSISNLLKAKDDINHSGSSFVIFLGNNTGGPDKYDIAMFSKIINKISKPVYVGIGNKDIQKTKDLGKKEYYRFLNKFSKNRISKLPCVKNLNGFTFIFMDGTNEAVPLPRGYYREKELIWLEKTLEKNKNNDIVILQHFPIVAPKENSSKATYNVEPYKNLIAKHKNIKAVVSGHFQEDFETEDENGIKHISVPSLGANGEYKVINIQKIGKDFLIKTKTIDVE